MKIKNIIFIASLLLIICCVLLRCGNNKSGQANSKESNDSEHTAVNEGNPYKEAEIKAVIIPAENNTFGYDIYLYGSVLIHQPARPGLPGNTGFTTEEDAMKVAELVMKKIRNNEMPPTVTIEELQELRVL